MRPRRLLWLFLPWYLLATLASLAALSYYGTEVFTRLYYRQREQDLGGLARTTAEHIADRLHPDTTPAEAQALCRRLGALAGARLTVIAPDGRVLCDTEKEPSAMDNHGGRPEVREAFEGRTGVAVRFSSTLEENLMYVAVPFPYGGGRGAVRYAVSVGSLAEGLAALRNQLLAAGALALLLLAVAGALLARRVTGPLSELRRGAERYARGDFSHRIAVPQIVEFAVLAEEMNRMAAELDERIEAVVRQRNELGAVLASMVEGVLAFDTEANLINLNRAAAGLLGIRAEAATGRSIQEAVRNPELQEFVARALAAGGPIEAELAFYDAAGERFVQAHGSPLADAAGGRIGALLVLNDITRLRRLEKMRREFVANASHEIRTPVTSISGFIETLQDGAIDDPGTARRFLAIMRKNSDRLAAIIDDLLKLSRIEKEAERGEITLEEVALADVADEALEACHQVLEAKQIRVRRGCPTGVAAHANPSLLVQAAVNLVDNAAKYSPPGAEVTVSCGEEDGRPFLRVEDQGVGIPREHLPRLFERFYRVDKARSRDLGGTGLGLAIVKHIVQAHHGEIAVESQPGRGSTFTIWLPGRAAAAPPPQSA